MSQLDPGKLQVNIDKNLNDREVLLPRRYTLTHSDVTGDLFLTIGRIYDEKAISGWYTQVMRDEVLGEWLNEGSLGLHIHLHVSGGLTFGPAKWRESIFRQHLPLVLEAISYGDRQFISDHPKFQQAPYIIHFHAKQANLDKVELWGTIQEYAPSIQ